MESRKTAAGRSVRDAIAMLKADHERVRQLCEQFGKAAGARTPDEDRKRQLAERLCQEVDVHAQLEEELFYPAVRAAIPDGDLMDEAQVGHASAKDLVRQIRAMSPGDDLYDARVKVLGEYVAHHVQEEESRMFPKAKRAGVDLADLGRRIAERRQQLESEHAMEPFDTLASMLLMPIRAAASAARAGAAAGRRAAADGTRSTGTRANGATGARKGATGARKQATGGATRAARGAGAAGIRATPTRTAATRATTTQRAGTRPATPAATGRGRTAAGGRASASAGTTRGESKGGKASAAARRSRSTR